jgi:hypothetical protein
VVEPDFQETTVAPYRRIYGNRPQQRGCTQGKPKRGTSTEGPYTSMSCQPGFNCHWMNIRARLGVGEHDATGFLRDGHGGRRWKVEGKMC